MAELTTQVRWRGRLLSVNLAPEATMGDLRTALAAITDVPPHRQTMLIPARRGRPASEELVAAVLPAAPVTMLGTPSAVQAGLDNAEERLTDDEAVVADDLDELAGEPLPPPPPPPPPPAAGLMRRDWQPEGGVLPSGVPFPAPATVEEVGSSEEEEVSSRQMTNGAALRLEEVDDFLAPALCGQAFTDEYGGKESDALKIVPEARFMKAVTESKAQLRMLAVLLFNMPSATASSGAASSSEGDESDDDAAASRTFFDETLQSPLVSSVLNENFCTFAADLSKLPDNGDAFLHRLGLHGLPAVLLLSDVGSGVAMVDMFAGDFFAGSDAANAVASRLLETQSIYEFAYEAARAQRVASETRLGVIEEQDAEFSASQAADRARVDAEREAEAARVAADEARVREVDEAHERLPKEPVEGGARLALRLPDGRRLERRFNCKESFVSSLFDWVVSSGIRKDMFALSVSYPRKPLTLEQHGSYSLEAVGLSQSTSLLVDML